MKQWKQTQLAAILTTLVLAMRAHAQDAITEEIRNSKPQRRIVISIPDRKLALIEDGRVVKIYNTAVGKPKTPTPVGTFNIINRIPKPTWYGPKEVVPPGKANPLGTRWMGLSAKGYGIHGTNSPLSIGKKASGGCIRMRNADVEELFELVQIGDVVELVSERTEELAEIFGNPDSAEPAPVPAAE